MDQENFFYSRVPNIDKANVDLDLITFCRSQRFQRCRRQQAAGTSCGGVRTSFNLDDQWGPNWRKSGVSWIYE